MKVTIVFSCFLSCFLLLMLPCFSAVGVNNSSNDFYVESKHSFVNELDLEESIQRLYHGDFDFENLQSNFNSGKLLLTGISLLLLIVVFLKVYDTMWKNRMINSLFDSSKNISDQVFTYDQLAGLPEPVQRYFKYSLQQNQSYISYVRLKHGGQFRIKPDQNWMSIDGQEYFTTQNFGFVWFGKVPLFSATDLYINGQGNLKVKLLSIIPIVDAKGMEIDQGEMLRWLGEAPWYPTALLPSEKIKWESIDNTSAKVILNYDNRTAEGIFHFNEQGQITQFNAKRYYEGSLENWTGHYNNYQEVNGIKIPFNVEVVWKLESGDYSYAKFKINEIEYNNPYKFKYHSIKTVNRGD